jgi:MoaA/NifB/PqqE/SkfB family radical SAM enzyme
MQLINKPLFIKSILNRRLFNKKTPLSVSWTLTNRCNHKCKYCNLLNIVSEELTTKQIFSIIDELDKLGTQRIGFTGGEPLLREDINKIIDYSHNKGIFTGLVSNGSLVQKKINEIKNLDLLQLSLDGLEEINDKQRYKGSYKDVISAIKTTKGKIPKIWLTCVLTKKNLNSIDFILELARQYNLKVFFQPVVDYENCGLQAKTLFPDKDKYKETIKKLIILKKKNQQIGNSKVGLKYLQNWPIYKKLNCNASKLFAHIYPNGDVYPCFNMDGKKPINCLSKDFNNAFKQLKLKDCKGCWTYANIEMNYLFNFNFNAGWNSLKLLR